MSAPPQADSEARDSEASPGLTLRRELLRKGLHILSTAVPVAYATLLSRPSVIWVLGVALAIALTVEIARSRSARARATFDASVGALLRDHERHSASGATWLIVALLFAAVFFPRDVAIAAMCAVTLGDAAAAVIGRTAARVPVHRKSFSGSAACFAATVISARAIAGFPWGEAMIAGILAAAAERPRRPFDDNLRIVLGVGCGILLWRMGFS